MSFSSCDIHVCRTGSARTPALHVYSVAVTNSKETSGRTIIAITIDVESQDVDYMTNLDVHVHVLCPFHSGVLPSHNFASSPQRIHWI